MLLAKELLPLCEFITTSVVIALGGDPKKVHSEMAVYGFIHQKNCHVANQIQDLFVMLDYLYVLKKMVGYKVMKRQN